MEDFRKSRCYEAVITCSQTTYIIKIKKTLPGNKLYTVYGALTLIKVSLLRTCRHLRKGYLTQGSNYHSVQCYNKHTSL